jgi:hypothetical protein
MSTSVAKRERFAQPTGHFRSNVMRRSNIRAWYRLAVSITPLVGAACADFNSPRQSSLTTAALTGAFSTVPVGYGDITSSFVGTSAASVSSAGFWLGGGRKGSMDRGSLMGGGLAANFSGEGEGFGRGGGNRGPFGGGLACTGTFNSATGRVTCAAETRNGLTIARSAQYKDAAGAVQQAFDSATTNSVNTQSTVTGTVTYTPDSSSNRGPGSGNSGRGGGGRGRACWGDGRGAGGLLLGDTATIVSATTTVNNTSERTVTGLASNSTQRTVNGTSRGQESTTGESSRGKFTATRVAGDTTAGVVIPVTTTGTTYPTAGTVIRAMQANLTYEGQAATTVTRREVVTYDGTATAKVVITENGTTRNCTRPLPRGPLTCS